MISGIHYFSTELKSKIDTIPRGCFKDKSTYPEDMKRYIRHVHKDWCTEMSTVSHTQHPSFP